MRIGLGTRHASLARLALQEGANQRQSSRDGSPEEDASLYEQAKTNNPEPSCMVPVLAVGFEGLKRRLEMQEEQLKIHREKIDASF